MNKKRVDSWILPAKEALEITQIAVDGTVDSSYRSQIASFGAAVVMGSLKAAVAFFGDNGGAEIEREKILEAIYYCIYGQSKNSKEIIEFVCKNDSPELKEMFIDASIAVKLAINFFSLRRERGDMVE